MKHSISFKCEFSQLAFLPFDLEFSEECVNLWLYYYVIKHVHWARTNVFCTDISEKLHVF